MGNERTQHDFGAYDNGHGHFRRHPFAYAALAGAMVGVGVGLIVAPRKGSELRKEMGTQLTHMKTRCASSLDHAKGKASDWGKKGRDAYQSTRRVVGKGAHETQRYLSEVAGAVTMKSRKQAGALTPQLQSSRTPPPAVKADTSATSTHERERPSIAVKSS